MSEEVLRAAQAAKRIGVSTRQLVRLMHERKVRYVMVDGIAHVPESAVEEFLHPTG